MLIEIRFDFQYNKFLVYFYSTYCSLSETGFCFDFLDICSEFHDLCFDFVDGKWVCIVFVVLDSKMLLDRKVSVAKLQLLDFQSRNIGRAAQLSQNCYTLSFNPWVYEISVTLKKHCCRISTVFFQKSFHC